MVRRGAAALALGAALLIAASSRADVRPGDVITAASADKVKDLVSPAMFWCVEHGFPMTIVEPRSITLRRAFVEATEKYSAQVKLSEDGLRMELVR